MKICSKCHKNKDIGCFAKSSKAADGLFSWCKDCKKSYRKGKYEIDIEKSRLDTNERRKSRIKWIQDLKLNIPCIDCKKIYEPYCMDYDHVLARGIKIKSVSRMVLDNTPKKIILDEIKKCDLVCLLCHNKRTYDRFNEVLGEDRKYRSHQQRNINIINIFKNVPCSECDIQYKHYNMQIDHINPSTKLYDVCNLKNYKEEKLRAELAKCQVLCALCHRKKSIIEQQDDRYSAPRENAPKRVELFYDVVTNTKECGLCHQIKDGIYFRSNKKMTYGLDTYCKDCFNEYRRERRK